MWGVCVCVVKHFSLLGFIIFFFKCWIGLRGSRAFRYLRKPPGIRVYSHCCLVRMIWADMVLSLDMVFLEIHTVFPSPPPLLIVFGAEVRLLPLQRLQPSLGECLRVVCSGHKQGSSSIFKGFFFTYLIPFVSKCCCPALKVYFKQFCRTCQKSFNPYRVEDITCQVSWPPELLLSEAYWRLKVHVSCFRAARRRAVHVQRRHAMWILKGRTDKTCAVAAKASGSPATAHSVLNTSYNAESILLSAVHCCLTNARICRLSMASSRDEHGDWSRSLEGGLVTLPKIGVLFSFTCVEQQHSQ